MAYIWFALIGVLITGYIVSDGFDLGAGILYPFIAKTEEQKRTVLRSIGPVWDGNEVWLLTAGGALFAAFPAVYATVFSGFYLALMLVLFCLILRAAALEFRNIDEKWRGFWDGAFFVASFLPSLLVGVAAGNVIRGVPLTAAGEFGGSFFTLLNPFALLVGVVGLVWIIWHGSSWLSMKTVGTMQEQCARIRRNVTPVLILAVALTTAAAFALAPDSIAHGLTSPIAISGAIVVVLGLVLNMLNGSASLKAASTSLASGGSGVSVDDPAGPDLMAFVGSALAGLGAVGIWAGSIFPYLLPARAACATKFDAARSLTIVGSSSSNLTLTVMLIIACIGVPLVLFYMFLIYKTYAGRIEIRPGEQSDGYY